MKQALALIVALSMAAIFGSATLVGAECAYHKSQAAVDKADTSKTVATAPTTDKADTGQTQTAQAEQPAKPAAEVKK